MWHNTTCKRITACTYNLARPSHRSTSSDRHVTNSCLGRRRLHLCAPQTAVKNFGAFSEPPCGTGAEHVMTYRDKKAGFLVLSLHWADVVEHHHWRQRALAGNQTDPLTQEPTWSARQSQRHAVILSPLPLPPPSPLASSRSVSPTSH